MSDNQAETGKNATIGPPVYHRAMHLEEWQSAVARYAQAKGWWDGFPSGDVSGAVAEQRYANRIKNPRKAHLGAEVNHFIAAKLALIHSEVSEALEALRDSDLAIRIPGQGTPESGKPEGLESELADVIIRVLDLSENLGMDMASAMVEKMRYNDKRQNRHGGRAL